MNINATEDPQILTIVVGGHGLDLREEFFTWTGLEWSGENSVDRLLAEW